jgi:HSP20 family molecular chaperone IbpA
MSLSTATEGPFSRATKQMNSLLDQMQKGYYGFYRAETWTPAVNLYENDTAYLVCVDLAGVDKNKIDIEVVQRLLTLRGTRAVPSQPGESGPGSGGSGSGGSGGDSARRKLRVHLMEIDHGAFVREVELPVDVVSGSLPAAVYRDGMLWIELPKKAGA